MSNKINRDQLDSSVVDTTAIQTITGNKDFTGDLQKGGSDVITSIAHTNVIHDALNLARKDTTNTQIFSGNITAGKGPQSGDEGGQINFEKPSTGSTSTVNPLIDINGDLIRFISYPGGVSRYIHMDLSAGVSGVVWHSGNDGSTSTLDAGLLHAKTISVSGGRWDCIPFVEANGRIEIGTTIDFHETNGDTGDFDGSLQCVGGELRYDAGGGQAKVWTAANDGAGTGLAADTLDGQHDTFYLDRGNHTGTQDLATSITGHDKAAHDALNIDADTLDTYQASAFPRKAESATISSSWIFSSNLNTTTLQVGSTPVTGSIDKILDANSGGLNPSDDRALVSSWAIADYVDNINSDSLKLWGNNSGVIHGLTLSNSSGTYDAVEFFVQAGAAVNAEETPFVMESSNLFTKRVDNVWNTGNGARPTLVPLADRIWYNVFLISKLDGSSTQIAIDNGATGGSINSDSTIRTWAGVTSEAVPRRRIGALCYMSHSEFRQNINSTVISAGDIYGSNGRGDVTFVCINGGTTAASTPAAFTTAVPGDIIYESGAVSWSCRHPGIQRFQQIGDYFAWDVKMTDIGLNFVGDASGEILWPTSKTLYSAPITPVVVDIHVRGKWWSNSIGDMWVGRDSGQKLEIAHVGVTDAVSDGMARIAIDNQSITVGREFNLEIAEYFLYTMGYKDII